jgi:hypothetical protein
MMNATSESWTLHQGIGYGEWEETGSYPTLEEAIAAATDAVPDAIKTVHGADFTVYGSDGKPVAVVNATGVFLKR